MFNFLSFGLLLFSWPKIYGRSMMSIDFMWDTGKNCC